MTHPAAAILAERASPSRAQRAFRAAARSHDYGSCYEAAYGERDDGWKEATVV